MDDGILVKKQLCFVLLIGLTILLETNAVKYSHHISVTDRNAQILHSRDYPDGYPEGLQEFWYLTTADRHGMRLIFYDFVVEECSGSNCTCDYLALYDGNTTYDSLIGKFCGSALPPSLLTLKREMVMVFRTDGSVNKKGFRSSVEAVIISKVIFNDEMERNMTSYFLKKKRQQTISTSKWGADIARSAVALFLYDPLFFEAGNRTGEEIGYELTLQTMSKLIMKKQIPTKDLALLLSAMTVACIDPKKFYGLNLVAELRKRVDSSNDTNPFLLLSLCINGDDMKVDDVLKLQSLFDAKLRFSGTGTQAMVIMALKCMARQFAIPEAFENMLMQLKRNHQEDGSIKNLKNTLLVIQTIIATGSNLTNFNMSMALQAVANSLKRTQVGIEEMYYILPIIKWKSLLHINSSHCTETIHTDLGELKLTPTGSDQEIQIQTSIIIGDDEEFFTTWNMKVPPGFSFYEALENISSSESNYNVQFMILKGKPYIAGVNNFNNSVEDALFWFIYTRKRSSNDDLKLVEESPIDIKVDETIEYILWYRSESRRHIQEVSSVNTEGSAADVLHSSSTVEHD